MKSWEVANEKGVTRDGGRENGMKGGKGGRGGGGSSEPNLQWLNVESQRDLNCLTDQKII